MKPSKYSRDAVETNVIRNGTIFYRSRNDNRKAETFKPDKLNLINNVIQFWLYVCQVINIVEKYNYKERNRFCADFGHLNTAC